MAYRALTSFAGAVSMAQGDTIEKIDAEIAKIRELAPEIPIIEV